MSIPDYDHLSERLIQAEERKAAALETIAYHLPALIEAMKTRPSYGGGNRKQKDAVGFFPFVPDLNMFQKNDTIHVPATCFAAKNGKVTFYSPFTVEGNLAMKQQPNSEEWYKFPGAPVGTIKKDSDLFRRIFGDWNPNEAGTPVWFKDGQIKILTISIGENKPQEGRPAPTNKFFSFIVGIKDAETTDPLALQFTSAPITTPVQQNGNS